MNMPTSKEKDNSGLQLSDLMGSLVSVRLIDAQSTQKNKQDVIIVSAEYGDSQVKFGVISENAIKAFLAHGTKDESGIIMIEVPERILSQTPDGKIAWLNFAY
jgi:hypothetical protein